eukprot:3338242-Rhodomonas_salina.2
MISAQQTVCMQLSNEKRARLSGARGAVTSWMACAMAGTRVAPPRSSTACTCQPDTACQGQTLDMRAQSCACFGQRDPRPGSSELLSVSVRSVHTLFCFCPNHAYPALACSIPEAVQILVFRAQSGVCAHKSFARPSSRAHSKGVAARTCDGFTLLEARRRLTSSRTPLKTSSVIASSASRVLPNRSFNSTHQHWFNSVNRERGATLLLLIAVQTRIYCCLIAIRRRRAGRFDGEPRDGVRGSGLARWDGGMYMGFGVGEFWEFTRIT